MPSTGTWIYSSPPIQPRRLRPGRRRRGPRAYGLRADVPRRHRRGVRAPGPAPDRRRVRGRAAASRLGATRLDHAADRHAHPSAGPPRPAASERRLGRSRPARRAMSFRARVLAGFGVVVLVPLVAFGVRVRADMADRLTAEYHRRVASLAAVIRADLSRDSAGIAARLDALKEAIAMDNKFRRPAPEGVERAYLLADAGRAMHFTGLSMLLIQDDQGRIIRPGHFRHEY